MMFNLNCIPIFFNRKPKMATQYINVLIRDAVSLEKWLGKSKF